MSGEEFISQVLEQRPFLQNFALSLTGYDRFNADDLFQETMLRALRNKDNYTEDNLAGWLRTIMRNLFYDHLRSVKRSPRHSIDISYIEEDMPGDRGFAPDASIRSETINNMINELPDKFREPFVLFIHGFSYKEIARLMRMPKNSVGHYIRLARVALQSAFAQDELGNPAVPAAQIA